MSTTDLKTNKSTMESWPHPDAPKLYPKGRECSRALCCITFAQTGKRGKLSRYTKPVLTKTEKRDEVVLCSPCHSKWIDSGVDAETFIGRKSKQGKAKRYKLPNLKRIRRAKGFHSMRELEKASGVSRSHIKNVEAGEWCGTNPAGKLARALGVRVDELREI